MLYKGASSALRDGRQLSITRSSFSASLSFSVSGISRSWFARARIDAQFTTTRLAGAAAPCTRSRFAGICVIVQVMDGEPAISPVAIADPILKRFRAALDELYGDRAERVVLFGSRARGDEHKDSDYDIAVFIKDPGPLADELHRLADVSTDILLDTGAVISAKPFYAGAYRERTGFMYDLRRDGIDL